jgi:hypothetical protein
MLDMFAMFEKGLPPVAGGVLNQSASFLNAAKYFASQEQSAKEIDSE